EQLVEEVPNAQTQIDARRAREQAHLPEDRRRDVDDPLPPVAALEERSGLRAQGPPARRMKNERMRVGDCGLRLSHAVRAASAIGTGLPSRPRAGDDSATIRTAPEWRRRLRAARDPNPRCRSCPRQTLRDALSRGSGPR